VDTLLGWWREDVGRTMSLIGAATVTDLDRSLLDLPEGWT
jgi:isopentenyl diphosphate isomerase/L-lactate dehydrogenase-like FMN-dependent dehydrogenase